MRAVVCVDTHLEVADVDDPRPDQGQAVLEVRRCGICGSDLHARLHADEQADVLVEAGYRDFMRRSQRVVMGHELCGTVADYGPRTAKRLPTGTPVVALPLIRRGTDVHPIGLSAAAPGGYAEQVLVEASLMMPVPNGLALDVAALTEPMAIALHAVHRAEVTARDVAVVVGCGPVGLAVVAMLKAKGVRTVVASDYAPGRRALATTCGADIVIDPATDSPFATPAGARWTTTIPDQINAGIGALEGMQRLPIGWHHLWRLADKLGVTAPKRPVVFECVGVPGIIDSIITDAPLHTRVVVVGVCDRPDTIRPVMAISKEVDLRFVVGYTPLEFRDTLHLLADGEVTAAPLVTGMVGLDGVTEAFAALAAPDLHAKIVIDPTTDGSAITRPVLERR